MKPKALILGVTGQDGSLLSSLLVQRGYDVVGISRKISPESLANLRSLGIEKKVSFFECDVCDQSRLTEILEGSAPSEIYNLSGVSSVAFSFQHPDLTRKSILTPTRIVLDYCARAAHKPKFYNAGSSECFGNISEGSAQETYAFNPLSPYAEAKCEAKYLVDGYRSHSGVFCCTGLLFNHESNFRKPKFLTKKIVNYVNSVHLEKETEKLVLGNIAVERDWGWAPEFVEAMSRMLQQPVPEDFVICTGVGTKISDILDATFMTYGLNWHDFVETSDEFTRPNDVVRSIGDNSKAKSQLNWQPSIVGADVIKKMLSFDLSQRRM